MEKGALSKKRKIQTNNENSLVFKRRKNGIKKKAEELAVLCDIPVCLVIRSPSGEYEIWPENSDQIRTLLNKYKQTCNESQAKTRSVSPSEISTGKLSLKTDKEITDQERIVFSKYYRKSEETQPKILTQNPDELRMYFEKLKKSCNESEAKIFNQNSSLSLCPRKEGLSENPREYECSENLGRITHGSNFSNGGKEPLEDWCDKGNVIINDPCFFSEVYDLSQQEVHDPNSKTGTSAGTSFLSLTNIEDFSLTDDPNLQFLDSSVINYSSWLSCACQESNLWSSIFEEVGVPSLVPEALMPESPEPAISTRLWEWQ